jgi:hypothetical protein
MLSTALVVLLVVALGTRAADNLRVRQQEAILRNLAEPEARAYYVVLRRRVRRVAVLRVVALLSLIALFYCYKYHLAAGSAGPVRTTQVGMVTAVAEVDAQADQQPDPQPQPVRPA